MLRSRDTLAGSRRWYQNKPTLLTVCWILSKIGLLYIRANISAVPLTNMGGGAQMANEKDMQWGQKDIKIWVNGDINLIKLQCGGRGGEVTHGTF